MFDEAFYEAVATARDWSLILLALEAIVCATPVFLILLRVTQWLRRFLPKVQAWLKSAQAAVARISQGVDRALAGLRAPFLWIEGTKASVRGFCQGWKDS